MTGSGRAGSKLAALIAALSALFMAAAVRAAPPTPAAPASDIPATFTPPTTGYDYVKRVEMIPMRDGVKLYTVIWVPKGAKDLPILLTRTPYNSKKRGRGVQPTLAASLPLADEDFVRAGYIRVYQDIRGKTALKAATR